VRDHPSAPASLNSRGVGVSASLARRESPQRELDQGVSCRPEFKLVLPGGDASGGRVGALSLRGVNIRVFMCHQLPRQRVPHRRKIPHGPRGAGVVRAQGLGCSPRCGGADGLYPRHLRQHVRERHLPPLGSPPLRFALGWDDISVPYSRSGWKADI